MKEQKKPLIIKPYSRNKTSLKVKQVDIETAECLNIFKNRYQAAKWIIENDLTNYFCKSIGFTRACIAGSLTNSIYQDKAAYGYKWVLLDNINTENITIHYNDEKQPKKLISKSIISKEIKEFNSINSASKFYHCDTSTIKYYLDNKLLFKTEFEFKEVI